MVLFGPDSAGKQSGPKLTVEKLGLLVDVIDFLRIFLVRSEHVTKEAVEPASS